ncbi:MAG: sulfite exporter TauE/SafE family protein [Actinomycetota bacterium]|nr:sulfite exporter TauE/SafE family protein [Actinomycetota bacterium]
MIEAALIGVAAGVLAGLFGVGGGALFVPALTIFLGLSHLEAEATSLLAIVPVALVGAWRQRGYGNLRVGDGVTVGLLAVGGAVLGVVLANALPERALELGFAALLVVVAVQMVRRALSPPAAGG